MKIKGMISVLLVTAFFLTGCASIVGQSVFPLSINSNPNGANILVTDETGKQMFAGTTPANVTLTAGEAYFHAKKYHITFSKEGYADQYAEVRAEISGWYFGNILFGGLIGLLIVDPLTGKMWKLPKDVNANLTEKTALNQNANVHKTKNQNYCAEYFVRRFQSSRRGDLSR